MYYQEISFEGIPGPTHLFSGLSHGNTASELHQGQISRPKLAAKQSIEKIKFISSLGIRVAIVPPQRRPKLDLLKSMGYSGTASEILKDLFERDPKMFKALVSSSSMWTANAATISPSLDTSDSRLHLTTANLKSNFHRSIEAQETHKYFRQVFATNDFALHAPLHSLHLDEGAANHSRFCEDYDSPGLELFVYGYSTTSPLASLPRKYPARQSLEAAHDIIKAHNLDLERAVLAQQNPEAIDAGVFHNDVISTGNKNFFFYHQKAFAHQDQVIKELEEKYSAITGGKKLILLEVQESEISLVEAVSSYIFNSQIVSPLGSKDMIMVCPLECKEQASVKTYIDNKILANPNIPISQVHYLSLNESMHNGGGPACLRLRILMSEKQIAQTKQEIYFDNRLEAKLLGWIEEFYPEELDPAKLIDEKFLVNLDKAYTELARMLNIQLISI